MREDARAVRMGELAVAREDEVLAAVGLGSCIGVALFDPEARLAGLAHVLLPEPTSGREGGPGRFASTAVPALLEELIGAGAGRERIVAKMAGGASMFRGLSPNGEGAVGERNAAAVRRALEQLDIPLLGEDVGGNWGRTVYVQASDSAYIVSNVLREDVVL
ncbi:MAG TPA: hypothetical protein VMN78_06735 [Longimicrobiales bacterium]|nr:hypothetical protein [Longimicrobiales bacterium]